MSGVPFHCTMADWVNPVPVTARIKVTSPTFALAGEMLVSVGAAGVMVKGSGFDGALPGSVRVRSAAAYCRIRFAGTAAVNCVALTNVVVNGVLPSETAAV